MSLAARITTADDFPALDVVTAAGLSLTNGAIE
jgi:hypothetical protein